MSQQDNENIDNNDIDLDADGSWDEMAESIKLQRKKRKHSSHRHSRHKHRHSSHRHSSHRHGMHNYSSHDTSNDSSSDIANSTHSRHRSHYHTSKQEKIEIEKNLKEVSKGFLNDSTLDDDIISSRSKKKKKKKMPLYLKIILGILIFIFVLAIALVSAFFILRNIGEKELFSYDSLEIGTIDNAITYDDGKTVTYNGKRYEFNEDVTSILFMGIDRRNLGTDDGIIGTGGQADAIFLLTYDRETGRSKILSFSRDTIVDVNTYATNGDYAGIEHTQLCLAYAYGDGKELSATNMITSVQRILFNIPINTYFAMDLDAIKIINDDIGGVTLTPIESIGDFIIKGQQITLDGSLAELYIRNRDTELLESNAGRIERQKHYLMSFADQIVPAIKKDLGVPISLYNDAKDYTVTNLNASKITYLASNLATTYSGLEFVSIPGEIVESKEDGKAEFILDEIKLYEILLDTFYKVKE